MKAVKHTLNLPVTAIILTDVALVNADIFLCSFREKNAHSHCVNAELNARINASSKTVNIYIS